MSPVDNATLEFQGEFPNEVIRASAGTGKTFELSNRYLRLLASGVECSSILATTFSRKGAGEILERIMLRLSAAALSDAGAEALSEELNWKLTRKRAADILHELLKNLHRLEVSTLDGFFNRFAKAFSLELGLPATWEIVENQVIERLQDQAIERILHDEHVVSLFHLMSHGEVKRRIATELRDVVKNLYEVFTDANPTAWEKIPRRKGQLDAAALTELVEKMLDTALPKHKKWDEFWHKLIDQIYQEDWSKIINHGLIKKVVQNEAKYYTKEIPPEVQSIARTLIDHCGAILTNQLISQNVATRDLLARFGEEFERLKSRNGQLRFNDVTHRLSAYIDSINVDGLTFRLDSQVRHLMLDEFQDTSPGQWNVIAPFADRVTGTHSDDASHSFFCVGDGKQAIFGWRGGEAEIFDRVENELSNLADTVPRTKSWRSSPHVIEFVNRVFQNLDRYQPDPKKYQNIARSVHAWKAWFNEHETARTDLDGCVTVEFAEEIDNEKGKTDTKESLYASTIARVTELNRQLPQSNSIGVLVRTRKEIAEIVFRLRQLGISASEEGGNPLTDSAAVEIVLCVLKLADSPGDSVSRFRISHSPLGQHFGIEPQDGTNRSTCQKQAIAASKRIRHELVAHGYGAYLESLSRMLASECTAREANRLQQLVQIAYSTESNGVDWELRPGRFVRFIRDEYKAVEPSSARIRVMTIHASKGLEFDAVVVPMAAGRSAPLAGQTPKVVTGRSNPTAPIDMVTRHVSKETQGILPESVQTCFAQREAGVVRESMCLLYVALTRAIHATHVILSPDTKATSATPSSVVLATTSDADQDFDDTLLVHQAGNPDWYLSADSDHQRNESKAQSSYSGFYLPATASLNKPSITREIRSRRGISTLHPSTDHATDATTFGDVLQVDRNFRATVSGSLIHACFEKVEWLDVSEVPDDGLLFSHLRRLNPDPDLVKLAVDSFRQAIEQDNIRKLLSHTRQDERFNGKHLHVMNEHPFAVATESGQLAGTIDRLIIASDAGQVVQAEIIDFKSNEITSAQAVQKAASYRPQMQAYAEAIGLIFKLPPAKITCTIVFTRIDQVVQLDDQEIPDIVKMTPEKPAPTSPAPTSKSGKQQTLW